MIDFLTIFYEQKSSQPAYFSSANMINLINQWKHLLLTPHSRQILYSYCHYILLKFSKNILQIEYQMLVLAHTDLRKYEATIGFLAIFNKQRIYPTSLFLSANVINLIRVINQWKPLLLKPPHSRQSSGVWQSVMQHIFYGTFLPYRSHALLFM